MKTISIVMPVYGVEEYIEASIRSICRQTNQNFELILVDDGCVDKSIQIACQVIEKENVAFSYKVITQNNAGVSVARNSGIKESKSEWIICIDSDDIIHQDTISHLLLCVEKFGDKYDLIWFDYKTILNQVQFSDELDNNVNVLTIDKDLILKQFLKREKKLISPAVLVKKSFIYKNDLWYLDSCKYSEDQLTIWKYLYASNGICYLDEKLYSYLRRPESTMTSSGIEKIMTGYYAFHHYIDELISKNPKDEIARMILPRWIFGALHAASRIMNFQDFLYLTKEMNYRRYISKLLGFEDIKIVVLTGIFLVSRRMFYYIAKLV